jgi:hypothetical protein
MKTIMSQCLTAVNKAKKTKKMSLSRTRTDECRETCDVSRCTIEMARTLTEARENPDRMLCVKM